MYYLGCATTGRSTRHVEIMTNRFKQMRYTVRRALNRKARKDTKIKLKQYVCFHVVPKFDYNKGKTEQPTVLREGPACSSGRQKKPSRA
jgi:hypothetical protein